MKRLRMVFVMVVMTVLGLQIIMPATNKAFAAETEVSWENPYRYKMESVARPDEVDCTGINQVVEIADESQTQNACITQGRGIRFGYELNRQWPRYLVGFVNDSKMYVLNNNWGIYDTLYYSVNQDALVVKIYLGGNFTHAGRIVVFKNFSHNLVKSNDFSESKNYKLINQTPDFEYASEDGTPRPVEELGMSPNGDWVVFQLRLGGVSMLNLETLETKRINNFNFRYNVGANPFAQFAVSNDGRYIAMTGLNLSLVIFKVENDCGSVLDDFYQPIINECSLTYVDDNLFNNIIGWYPRFNANNSELSLYSESKYAFGGWHHVVFRAEGYTEPKLNYLALGDSYSSGEGEMIDNNYLLGTNNEFEKCHTSVLSYAFRVSYNLNPSQTKNVACSGATTDDVIGYDDNYWGQGGRLTNLVPSKNLSTLNYLQSTAVDTYLPGRVHQETFVKKNQPKIITVGVGGNDIGFADKLKACLGPNTCTWAGSIIGRETTAVEIKNLYYNLVRTYQTLKNDSPESKIYVVGYPRFIEVDGMCSSMKELLLDRAEREFIDEGIIYLNQVIEAAAKKVGVKYISIADSYGNHKLCGSSSDKAANFIAIGDDMGLPGEWLRWTKLVGQESFHPNSLGHQLASAAILDAVNGDLASYDYCNGAISCPQNILPPEPSSYWLSEYHDLPTQLAVDAVDNGSILCQRFGNYAIRTRNYMFAPLSIVDIEVNSTPRSLGHFNISADGSLSTEITLPDDLEEGFHTIHIYGKSYSGEDIDLYKVIGYFKPEPVVESQPIIPIPVAKDNQKKELIDQAIVNNKDSDQISDEFSSLISGEFIYNNDKNKTETAEASILSASSTKKEPIAQSGDINQNSFNLLYNVIITTVGALIAAMITFWVGRYYKRG